MNIKIALVISIICGTIIFNSCSEPYAESIELEKFMYLSLSGATDNPIEKTVDLDKNTVFALTVSYGGTTNYEQGQITAEIAADNSLVSTYNTANNTTYLPLPAGAYSLDKSSVIIENGSKISDQVNVTIKPALLNLVNNYLLPISITSASGGKIPISEEFKTVYLIIKGNFEMEPLTEKWTVLGASSVWQPAFPVENLWDGNRNSYWHSSLTGMPQWFSVNMNGYKLVEGFTWVNRQDTDQHALPKHVKFETSMDGTNWTEVLDVPEMPNLRIYQVFELSQKVIAKYFKVTILSNWANAPYSYLAEVSTWAGVKPTGEYNWEKNTWKINEYSSQWNDGWPITHTIDGDKNTTWHSALTGMPQWFIIDMQKSRPAIKGILIWNRQDDHGTEPKNVVFSISDDNTNWTKILEIATMSQSYSSELDYKTTNPAPGRYLKVEVKSNWSGNPWTYFGEISVY